MHTLPSLVTPHGEFRLPLAEPTAERLFDALLCNEPQRRREHFRAAVDGDPALTIWTLAQAHTQGNDALLTSNALADWLAEQPARFFLPGWIAGERGDDSPLAEFAEPTGCSLAVAQLAEEFARHIAADTERAFLFGLVHLGSGWLSESVIGDAPPRPLSSVLPQWVSDVSLQLALPSAKQTPEINCVAQAMELVCSQASDAWRAMGCDARHWIGRWAVLGETWGKLGPWTQRLSTIATKLATLENLQGDFEHALQSAKLESMKELAYGAGHEINNPLANISARAQTLLQDETDPERRRTLAAINTQAFRAHEMIADMMLFARPPQPQREVCEVGSILKKLVEELASQAADQQTQFDLRLPEGQVVLCADPTQLAVAVRSLVVNSLEALVSGGLVEILLAPPSLADPWVRIAISDNGPGIPADMRPKIFDSYFSGREAGRGLGLGLSKCWRIVTLHGGRIDVAGGESAGARFTISLPASTGK